MSWLEQINKMVKRNNKGLQELKYELRPIKNENLDNYFNLARATEEKLQQMASRMETTDEEREKHIKNNIGEMKKRSETVNNKVWNLEMRMDTMGRDQAESSSAKQFQSDALLRKSIAQEKAAPAKTE